MSRLALSGSCAVRLLIGKFKLCQPKSIGRGEVISVSQPECDAPAPMLSGSIESESVIFSLT
jgi:hypothetical protein